ncbi:MAG: uroporphyrinogen decarboxylase family protein [Sedimentisphaeraceae bacterium JB056]
MTDFTERILNTFYRNEPQDVPPLGFFAIDSDSASKVLGRPTYWRAKAKCQIAFWEGRRDEVVESWKNDAIELYEKLDIIDIISVAHMAGECPPKGYQPDPPKKIADDTWQDRNGCIYKYSPVTDDISMIEDPQMWQKKHKAEDYENLEPKKPDESIFEVIDALIEHFKGRRFILGTYGHVAGWFLAGGMERGFMEIASNPEEVKKIYTAQCRKAIAEDASYIRPGQDGVLLGTDFASSQGPMISPESYRSLFYDAYKKRIANLKDNNQAVIQHACGNNHNFMDILTTIGADCYQSIQPSAGMDIIELHKKYGDRISLWGGIAVETLINGTPEDVKKEVEKFMDYAKDKTGLILGTSHSIAVGTKYENFMTLLDTYSKYK